MTDFYYNPQWQVLQERTQSSASLDPSVASGVDVEYLWGLRYIDALVCRWRDQTSDGDTLDAGDEHLY